MVPGLTAGSKLVSMEMGRRRPRLSTRAGGELDVAGQRLFDGGDGLVNLGIAEAGRKLDRAGLDQVERFAGKDVRERRSAAGVQIVGGPHEEVQIALERAGLGEHGLKRRIRDAAVVHAVAETKNRPAALSSRRRQG